MQTTKIVIILKDKHGSERNTFVVDDRNNLLMVIDSLTTMKFARKVYNSDYTEEYIDEIQDEPISFTVTYLPLSPLQQAVEDGEE